MRSATRFFTGTSTERLNVTDGIVNEDHSGPSYPTCVFFETDTGKTYINPTGAEWILLGGAATASFPVGVIVMWSGLLVDIPEGWALCDGQGGRPNLQSRFIKGAAAGVDPGTTGGAATHTHTGHTTHTSHGAQSHAPLTTGADGDSTGGVAKAVAQTPTTHPSAGFAHSAHSAHDTPNSEPAFYSLAYIIKT